MTGERGLTIIEVLFVVAIGGLILLIVFLAIPALERESQNNQRRQDVNNLLRAISEYELNNTGNFYGPCGTGGVTPDCSSFINEYHVSLTYYSVSDIQISPQSLGSLQNQPTSPVPDNSVEIYNFETCNGGTNGASVNGASYSDVVALYKIESSSNQTALACQQL